MYKTSQVVLVVKDLPANAGDARDTGLIPEVRKIPWRRKWHPPPVFMTGVKNPMDRGAWQATVHGVTKSRTQPSN